MARIRLNECERMRRKRKLVENECPITPKKIKKSPSYYTILNKSKQVRDILTDSPQTHMLTLKHVIKHARKSPRKASFLDEEQEMNRDVIGFVTPKNGAKFECSSTVSKEIRRIAVLRSQKKAEEAGQKVEELKKRYHHVTDIAKEANEKATDVYRIFSGSKKRVKSEYLRKLTEDMKADVYAIYNDDEVSYCLPDIKYAGFRFMSMTIEEAYKIYLKKSVSTRKVASKTFAGLKPKYIKTMQQTPIRGSRCERCSNLGMIRKTLVGLGIQGIPLNHSASIEKMWCAFRLERTDGMDIRNERMRDELPKRSCVSGTCTECGVVKYQVEVLQLNRERIRELEKVKWEQWGKIYSTTKAGKKISRPALLNYTGSCSKLLSLYFKQLKEISTHQFNKVWQLRNFNLAMKHLQPGQVLIVQDFQQNLLLYTQDETKSMHWDHPQITIHPTTVFYRCPKDGCLKIVKEDLIHISPDKDHDKHAVFQFFNSTLQHIKDKGIQIKELIIFTDNCSNQYKSKFTFYFLSTLSFPVTHHFYCAQHGKGPSDRSGGNFKRHIRSAVKANIRLLSTQAIAEYCKKSYDFQTTCPGPNDVEVMTKHGGKCPQRRRDGRVTNPHSMFKCVRHPKIKRPTWDSIKVKRLLGTQLLHAVRNTGVDGIVEYRRFDCCCFGCVTHSTPCSQQDYADEWSIASVVVSKYTQKFLSSFKHNYFPPIYSDEPSLKNDIPDSVTLDSDSGRSSDGIDGDESTDYDISDVEPLDKSDEDQTGDVIDNTSDSDDIQLIGVDEYHSSDFSYDEFCEPDKYVIPRTLIRNRDESQDFNWKQMIKNMEPLDSFARLKSFVREKSLPPVVSRPKYYIEPDDTIDEVGSDFWPKDAPAGYKPVETIADGNCGTHAIAHNALSDPMRHDEVRVRITFTAVMNEDNFLRHEILSRGSSKGSENRARSYALYSGQLPERDDLDLLDESDIRTIYRTDVLANRKDGNYMGIWQFHHAAEVFERPVASIYPRRTNRTIRYDLHRLIVPIETGHDDEIPMHVMWSPLHKDSKHFDVKHFLALFKEY